MNINTQYIMNLRTILILALCLYAVASYKKFQGKNIPKDYAIGDITFVEYIGNDKIYFITVEDVLGMINAKTGLLSVVYQLEDDQQILEHEGSRLLVIQKNKDINIFIPRDQTYLKLQYSEFLEKQNFKEIIAFKRFITYDYILTDQFLARAQNPFAQRVPSSEVKGDKFQIIQKKTDPNAVYFELIHAVSRQQPAIGLVSLKTEAGKQELCIEKIYITKKDTQIICHTFDANIKIRNVSEIGPNILVVTEEKNLIFNNKFQLIAQAAGARPISFIEQMSILRDINIKKNLNTQQASNDKIFMNFQKTQDKNSLQIFQKYMSVKKNNTLIVNIEKKAEDNPNHLWAYSRRVNAQEFDLIVEFVNGKVICYQIDEKVKSYSVVWNFHVNPADKSAKGEEKQAKQVDLQTEQKLLQEKQADKGSDLQNNGN